MAAESTAAAPFTSISEQVVNCRQELAALTDEAQAIQNLATEQGRELTDDENDRWNAITDTESGLIAQKTLSLQGLVEREKQVKFLAASRRQLQVTPSSVAVGDFGQEGKGAPPAALADAAMNSICAYAPRLNCFKGNDAPRDAYMSGMWLRMMIGRAWHQPDEAADAFCEKHNLRAQHIIGEGSRGGYTVPQPLARTLINILDTAGIARRLARVIQMTANTLDVPKKIDGVTVYYPQEASEITKSEQTFSQVNLVAVKRAVLSQVSQELQDDSVIPFMDDLIFQIGHDMSVQHDAEFINGDGTPTYGGELGVIPAMGTAGLVTAGGPAWSDITFNDLTDLMARVPDRYKQYETAFICSGAFYHSVMLPLLAQQGGSNLADIQAGDRGVMRWLGYPVYLTHQMPQQSNNSEVCLLYGAWSTSVLIGSRRDVSMAISQDRYFELDVTAVRSTARYDIEVHEPGDASNPGGYAGLTTAAA